ncbi:MAG: diaminopimelate epimerase, partial [Lactococcus garvieae]
VSSDFRMVYFNADGSESTMCGNGGRCLVQFARDLNIFQKEASFTAIDGLHHAQVDEMGIDLGMIDVDSIQQIDTDWFLNTGSPHLVQFVDDVSTIDVKSQGAAIRYSEYWKPKGGVNVNFVQVLNETSISVRTYERGVEDETYSCGTGVTAAAIASYFTKKLNTTRVSIQTMGGALAVSFLHASDQNFKQVRLIGPAKFVFEGYF